VDISDDQWKKVADDVEKCLRNFYNPETFSILKDLPPESCLEIEDFSFFRLDGKKIWAVIDCSYKTDDGIIIIDWKTGRGTTSDISLQLSCYAMYGVEKWVIRPERIKLVEYKFLSDVSTEFIITEGEIDDTKSYIKGSIADMESLLVDVENNEPKEERFFKKVEDKRVRDR